MRVDRWGIGGGVVRVDRWGIVRGCGESGERGHSEEVW